MHEQSLVKGTLLQQRYQILSLLGQGGMGAVYLAQDLRLPGRLVAIKENFDASPVAQSQFRTEASILARLDHPGLPRVTDHWVESTGRQYLIMDYVEGEDLDDLVERRGLLPEAQILGWVEQVMEALAYMHCQSPPVIHRDIKPANIRVMSNGNVMLVDFGLAKRFVAGQHTTVGARAVTPGFSPPEQYGAGRTDARSDIYALGATLYTLLTGQAPVESVARLAGAMLTPPRALNPHLSPNTEKAILWAMELDADRRPQTIEELRAELIGTTVVAVSPAATISCQRCGASCQATARFCGTCGASLQLLVPPPATPWPRRLLVVTGVLIFVLAATLGLLATKDRWGELARLVGEIVSTNTPIPTPTATRPKPTATPPSPTATQTRPPTSTPIPPSPPPRPQRIAFASDKEGNWDVYVMDPDGSNIVRLTTDPADDWGPIWSPAPLAGGTGGSRIAFMSDRSGSWQVYIMDTEGNILAQVTDMAENARFPAWSPKGRTIAFNSKDELERAYIWTVHTDGSGLRQLTTEGTSGRPAWSPAPLVGGTGGARIAFNAAREDTNGDGEITTADMWDIYVMDDAGGNQMNLTRNLTTIDIAAAWSPAGDRIVFVGFRQDTNGDEAITTADNADIYLINANGTGLVNLSMSDSQGEGDPCWSRSGDEIVYVVYGESEDALWVMGRDGSGRRLLLAGWGNLSTPAWSP